MRPIPSSDLARPSTPGLPATPSPVASPIARPQTPTPGGLASRSSGLGADTTAPRIALPMRPANDRPAAAAAAPALAPTPTPAASPPAELARLGLTDLTKARLTPAEQQQMDDARAAALRGDRPLAEIAEALDRPLRGKLARARLLGGLTADLERCAYFGEHKDGIAQRVRSGRATVDEAVDAVKFPTRDPSGEVYNHLIGIGFASEAPDSAGGRAGRGETWNAANRDRFGLSDGALDALPGPHVIDDPTRQHLTETQWVERMLGGRDTDARGLLKPGFEPMASRVIDRIRAGELKTVEQVADACGIRFSPQAAQSIPQHPLYAQMERLLAPPRTGAVASPDLSASLAAPMAGRAAGPASRADPLQPIELPPLPPALARVQADFQARFEPPSAPAGSEAAIQRELFQIERRAGPPGRALVNQARHQAVEGRSDLDQAMRRLDADLARLPGGGWPTLTSRDTVRHDLTIAAIYGKAPGGLADQVAAGAPIERLAMARKLLRPEDDRRMLLQLVRAGLDSPDPRSAGQAARDLEPLAQAGPRFGIPKLREDPQAARMTYDTQTRELWHWAQLGGRQVDFASGRPTGDFQPRRGALADALDRQLADTDRVIQRLGIDQPGLVNPVAMRAQIEQMVVASGAFGEALRTSSREDLAQRCRIVTPAGIEALKARQPA